LHILLVEDDAILAESTAALIERLGNHRVYITDDPPAVFCYCESGTIDIVMMDVNLAGARWQGEPISGADLSRSLKAEPITAHIPVVLVTAYALTSEREKLLELSRADGLYAKPIINYKGLLDFLNRLCKKD
jgi:two-component system, cell cycle response regulator DivK